MKSRDALSRLKRFEVEEKRRNVVEIESMIADFHQMATDLDRQIAVEQERAGVTDVNHYAYPTFAKAAIARRDNLLASATDLRGRLKAAQDVLAEAAEELKRIEFLEGRDAERVKLDTGHGITLDPAPLQHRVAS
jgi:flagellar export protein FliJ